MPAHTWPKNAAAPDFQSPELWYGTVLGNGAMGFVASIAFIFGIPNVSAAINDPSGFPLVYALNLRFSHNVTLGFVFLNWLLLMVSNVAYQAAVSRQTFAFGRDGGLPFSTWIGTLTQEGLIELRASTSRLETSLPPLAVRDTG